MEAYIKSIEFKKIANHKNYLKITFVDNSGNIIAMLDNPKINDDINFRNLMFGILSACNCYDLLRLCTNNPNALEVSLLEENDKVKALINKEYKVFTSLSREYGILSLDYVNPNIEKVRIESITSSSGTLSMFLKGEYSSTFYISGNIYYGFGYPLNSKSTDIYELDYACHFYRTYIESILSFYNTNDLLELGRTKDKVYPKVQIELDKNGNIISLGNADKDYYLSISSNSYDIKEKNISNIETIENIPKKLLARLFKGIVK